MGILPIFGAKVNHRMEETSDQQEAAQGINLFDLFTMLTMAGSLGIIVWNLFHLSNPFIEPWMIWSAVLFSGLKIWGAFEMRQQKRRGYLIYLPAELAFVVVTFLSADANTWLWLDYFNPDTFISTSAFFNVILMMLWTGVYASQYRNLK